MRAGRLRFIASLQNPSDTGDAYSTAAGYATVATGLRVDVVPLNGKEVRSSQQDGSEITVEIYARYRSDITAASRLVVDGATYEVVVPINLRNRNRDLRLQCKAVA